MPQKPWLPFKVGAPSTRDNWVEKSCQRFSIVTHVTHIANALTIIPGRSINPQLISDESRLNNRRLLVNWVSPNDWVHGYRYGNIEFVLNWQTLIAGKKFYWVEVMPYASRILITDKNYDGDADMIPYEPRDGDGPWWWDEPHNFHWRNGNCCLEFMLEFEIPIESCSSISFVKHHNDFCCIDPSTCQDKGLGPQVAAARFIAGVVGQDIIVNEAPINLEGLMGGWELLQGSWPPNGYSGDFGAGLNNAVAPALARSVLHAIWRRNSSEELNLAKLFSDKEALQSHARALIVEKFPELVI